MRFTIWAMSWDYCWHGVLSICLNGNLPRSTPMDYERHLFSPLLSTRYYCSSLLEEFHGWAIRRFQEAAIVQASTIVWVAAVGIAINTVTALMFIKGRKEDLNIRGAFLHMVADAIISVGVVVAGLLISLAGIVSIDPVVSILIALVIFIGTWSLLSESVNLAMHAVPEIIDTESVQQYLTNLPSVKDVHHLHLWALSTTNAAMTAHLVLSKPELNNDLLTRIRHELYERYRIDHSTIQVEACENEICLTKRCSLRYDANDNRSPSLCHTDHGD